MWTHSGLTADLPRWFRALPAALALLVSGSRSARADGLSAVERRIIEYVDAHRGEAVALLERVVNIPSGTQNLDGVRAVGKAFAPEFEAIGFSTRWESMPPEMKRAGHLIAEHRGTKGKRILLIGHLDTVLEGRRFTPIAGGPTARASGNGTVDMKGGNVILLQALQALHAAGALEDRRIAVILTGDEEDAGTPISESRSSMLELARNTDYALAFEAAIDDTATVARRGVAAWNLRVKGRTGHSSGIFGPTSGAGAIFETARILDKFRRELATQENLSFNASLILGGTEVGSQEGQSRGTAGGKRNVIPAEVLVEGDIRFFKDAQLEAARKTMRAIVAASLPATSAEIEFVPEYPAMAPTPGNYALLAVLDQASRDLGLGAIKPLTPGKRGAGDIAFIAHLVDGLDGLGPDGERSHAPEEWINLDSIPPQAKRAAVLIHRLTRDKPK
ncbi:MAG: M20 family metallopeptidase [Isosphaeraceae bacterium]